MYQQQPRQRQIQQNTHPIFKAISGHNIGDVKKLIEKDSSGAWKNVSFKALPPLHYAAAMGDVEIVEFLLSQVGIDVNALITSPHGHSAFPLTFAIQKDNVNVVRFLLQHDGVKVNLGHYKDSYLPYVAAGFNSPKTFAFFMHEKKMNINEEAVFTDNKKESLLQWIIRNKRAPIIEVLLDLDNGGSFVNLEPLPQDTSFFTPKISTYYNLYLACKRNDIPRISAIINKAIKLPLSPFTFGGGDNVLHKLVNLYMKSQADSSQRRQLMQVIKRLAPQENLHQAKHEGLSPYDIAITQGAQPGCELLQILGTEADHQLTNYILKPLWQWIKNGELLSWKNDPSIQFSVVYNPEDDTKPSQINIAQLKKLLEQELGDLGSYFRSQVLPSHSNKLTELLEGFAKSQFANGEKSEPVKTDNVELNAIHCENIKNLLINLQHLNKKAKYLNLGEEAKNFFGMESNNQQNETTETTEINDIIIRNEQWKFIKPVKLSTISSPSSKESKPTPQQKTIEITLKNQAQLNKKSPTHQPKHWKDTSNDDQKNYERRYSAFCLLDINKGTKDETIYQAIENGDVATVKDMGEKTPLLITYNKGKIISVAAHFSSIEIFKYLIESKANLCIWDGYTAVYPPGYKGLYDEIVEHINLLHLISTNKDKDIREEMLKLLLIKSRFKRFEDGTVVEYIYAALGKLDIANLKEELFPGCFHYAVLFGHLDLCKELFAKMPIQLLQELSQGIQKIYEAGYKLTGYILNNNDKNVPSFTLASFNKGLPFFKGFPPLITAILGANPKIVRWLLEQPDIEINCLPTGSENTFKGVPPFYIATAVGNEAIIELLLPHFSSKITEPLNSENTRLSCFFNEKTPLLIAAIRGHKDIVSLFLATLQIRPESIKQNPEQQSVIYKLINAAIENGHNNLAEELFNTYIWLDMNLLKGGIKAILSEPSTVKRYLEYVEAALMKITQNKKAIEQLIKELVDFTLAKAASKIHYNTIKMLIDDFRGGDINTPVCYRDDKNQSVFSILLQNYKIQTSYPLKVVKSLFKDYPKLNVNQNFYDPNQKQKTTPIFCLYANGDHDMLEIVLQHPNIDATGLTNPHTNLPLLHKHALECNIKTCKLLLKHPAVDVNQVSMDEKQETPLSKIITGLLEVLQKTNPNSHGYRFLSCLKECKEIIRLLLEHGASIKFSPMSEEFIFNKESQKFILNHPNNNKKAPFQDLQHCLRLYKNFSEGKFSELQQQLDSNDYFPILPFTYEEHNNLLHLCVNAYLAGKLPADKQEQLLEIIKKLSTQANLHVTNIYHQSPYDLAAVANKGSGNNKLAEPLLQILGTEHDVKLQQVFSGRFLAGIKLSLCENYDVTEKSGLTIIFKNKQGNQINVPVATVIAEQIKQLLAFHSDAKIKCHSKSLITILEDYLSQYENNLERKLACEINIQPFVLPEEGMDECVINGLKALVKFNNKLQATQLQNDASFFKTKSAADTTATTPTNSASAPSFTKSRSEDS